LALTGETVVQCKYTNRSTASLTIASLKDDIAKARYLWEKKARNNYVLLTNYRVTATLEEELRGHFAAFGCKECHVFGNEWITSAIRDSPRLRTLVPRLYGLGDLSQILDERWYSQTQKLLEIERENLRRFVPTTSYAQAVNALNESGFVLLLGAPAVGKTAIAATLTLASGDAWKCRPMKLERPDDLRTYWNPHDPQAFFWIDDAFGVTQFDAQRAQEWNFILSWLDPILNAGAKIVLTSRDYIYKHARGSLKECAFPLLREAQVVVDVAALSRQEREQILYNHVRLGDQSRGWKRAFKEHFDTVAEHVSSVLKLPAV
jgi:hypothetical protein